MLRSLTHSPRLLCLFRIYIDRLSKLIHPSPPQDKKTYLMGTDNSGVSSSSCSSVYKHGSNAPKKPHKITALVHRCNHFFGQAQDHAIPDISSIKIGQNSRHHDQPSVHLIPLKERKNDSQHTSPPAECARCLCTLCILCVVEQKDDDKTDRRIITQIDQKHKSKT